MSMNRLKGQEGVALVVVLLICFVMFLLSTFLLELSSTELKLTANYLNSVKALFLADAGVEIALQQLNQDNGDFRRWWLDWPSQYSFAPYKLGEGKVEVTLEAKDENGLARTNIVTIKSVGKLERGKTRKTLLAETKLTLDPVFFYTLSLTNQKEEKSLGLDASSQVVGDVLLMGGGDTGEGTIRGNIIAFGDLTNRGVLNGSLMIDGNVDNQEEIEGNVELTPGHHLTGQGRINGDVIEQPSINPPVIPVFSSPEEYASMAGTTYAGLTALNSENLQKIDGVVYIGDGCDEQGASISESGSLVISGRYSGVATIVTTGDIVIDGELSPDEADGEKSLLVLVCLKEGGEIRVLGQNSRVDALLICPYGSLVTSGKTVIHGNVFAASCIFGGSVELYGKQKLKSLVPPGLPGTRWRVISWGENEKIF